MRDSIDPKRLTRSQGGRLLVAATLVSATLVTGCGGNSTSPTAATLRGASAPASTGPGTYGSGPLAFAKCMRANGVPNFPDPAGNSGGFLFNATGIDPAAPAVQAARAKCHKFAPTAPGVGPPSFSSGETAKALVKLRRVAQCMRQHGISQFPDPTTTRPSNPFASGPGIFTDYDGAFLFFPATIDMQSPAFTHAAAACGHLAESFGHPH